MQKRKTSILSRLFKKKRKKSRKVEYLERELVRKDERMRMMEEKNDLLLKTTLRQSREIVKLQNMLKEINRKR